MTWLKRLAFMGLGASLVIVLAIGGVAVFAQSDDDGDEDAGELEETTPEAQDETQEDEDDDGLPWRFRRGPAVDVDAQALFAEALGISVEELEAAQEEVRLAAIEAALAEELITEEEAEALIEGGFGPRVRWGVNNLIDKDEVLAEALGISVEELEAAQAEVREARLQALVEAGVLTQEQAGLMAAQQAVREYIDVEALQATLQDAYEAAVEQALEEGVITEEQAQQLQENMPAFGAFGFGGGRHHHGFGGGPQGFGDGPEEFQFGPARGNRFQGSTAGA